MKKYEIIARHSKGRMAGSLDLHPTAVIGRRCSIDVSADVKVGPGAVLSEDVLVLTHNHVRKNIRKKTFSPLTIGANVFIGARTIILASCNIIGEDAVIGAGAVVTKDVPAGEVWAGNPARRLKGA